MCACVYVCLCVNVRCAGPVPPLGLHRHSGPQTGDFRCLLADGLAGARDHHRYAHQHLGGQQGTPVTHSHIPRFTHSHALPAHSTIPTLHNTYMHSVHSSCPFIFSSFTSYSDVVSHLFCLTRPTARTQTELISALCNFPFLYEYLLLQNPHTHTYSYLISSRNVKSIGRQETKKFSMGIFL